MKKRAERGLIRGSEEGTYRFLRAGFLAPVGDRLWAVDEFQPVAAVFEPASGRMERLVGYAELPPPPVTFAPWLEGWRVLGSDAGLWVQPYPGGPVALLGDHGMLHAGYSAASRLQATSKEGAWCAPLPAGQDVADAAHRPPQRWARPTELLLFRPNGTRAKVMVDRPVRSLRGGTDGVHARVELEPWARDHLGADSWAPAHEREWILLPTPGPSQDMCWVDEQPSAAAPKPPSWPFNGFIGAGSHWHSVPHQNNPGLACGGMNWALGSDPQRPGIDPHVIATGHHPDSNTELARVELGPGRVMAAAAAEPYLWVAIRRGRTVSQNIGGQTELVRLDVRDDHVETLAPAGSIEITEHCWPLPTKPVDADSYADYQRGRFEHFDTRQPANESPAKRLAERTRDYQVDLVGSWPNTTIHIGFSHELYPGLRLIRTLPLFDELGRQQPPEHSIAHLMEDIETGHLPSASEASNEILHV